MIILITLNCDKILLIKKEPIRIEIKKYHLKISISVCELISANMHIVNKI